VSQSWSLRRSRRGLVLVGRGVVVRVVAVRVLAAVLVVVAVRSAVVLLGGMRPRAGRAGLLELAGTLAAATRRRRSARLGLRLVPVALIVRQASPLVAGHVGVDRTYV
jgi:hypothetical protein